MGERLRTLALEPAMAITYVATFEPASGWALTARFVRQSEFGPVPERIVFRGLTPSELVDVLDATATQALQLV